MSEIFREIDEELRRENFGRLWQRYGRYVIVLLVLVVIATAGVAWWRQHRLSLRRDESRHYAAAMALADRGDLAGAAAALAALARTAGAGQAVIARLQEAALRAQAGDGKGASAALLALSRDGSADATYRDLATILAATYALPSEDPKAMLAELAPVTAADNPWRYSALELSALAQLRAGDKAAARQVYQKIADDLGAPERLRARAAEMSAALAD